MIILLLIHMIRLKMENQMQLWNIINNGLV